MRQFIEYIIRFRRYSLIQTITFFWVQAMMVACKPDCNTPVGNSFENATSADFRIGKYFEGADWAALRDTFIVSDTFVNRRVISFVAPKGFATYEWKIGDVARVFTSQVFSLNFSDPEPLLKVQLIVSGPPEPRCFVNADGRDTAIQYFTVVPWQTSAIFGTFRGVLDSAPIDTFDFTYDYSISTQLFSLVNFSKGCSYTGFAYGGDFDYKIAELGRSQYTFIDSCMDPVGYLFVSPDNQRIELPFSVANSIQHPNPRIRDRFTGVRVR